jgi:hypothetical protein
MLELWNDGFKENTTQIFIPNIPTFHASIIPCGLPRSLPLKRL